MTPQSESMDPLPAEGDPLADFDAVSFGKRIVSARKARSMSQADLAFAMGVSQGAVSGWECGRYPMVMGKLPQLCRALQVTPNELLPEALEIPVDHIHALGKDASMRLVAKVAGLVEKGVLNPGRVGILMALLKDFEENEG